MMRGDQFFDARGEYGKTRKMWGIGGNMMLNFGIIGFPLGYFVLGLLVGPVSGLIRRWKNCNDARLLIAPALTLICLWTLIADVDVLLRFLIHNMGMAMVVIYLGTSRVYFDQSTGASQVNA